MPQVQRYLKFNLFYTFTFFFDQRKSTHAIHQSLIWVLPNTKEPTNKKTKPNKAKFFCYIFGVVAKFMSIGIELKFPFCVTDAAVK